MGPRIYLSRGPGDRGWMLHHAECRYVRVRMRGSRIRLKGLPKRRITLWLGFDTEWRARLYAAHAEEPVRLCVGCTGTQQRE